MKVLLEALPIRLSVYKWPESTVVDLDCLLMITVP